MKLEYTYMDSIEFGMTAEQAKQCSHSGDCEADLQEVMKDPAIYSQLNTFSPKAIAKALEGYGAWDEVELADHEQNLIRFVWIAAGNIAEELDSDPEEHSHWDDPNDPHYDCMKDGEPS